MNKYKITIVLWNKVFDYYIKPSIVSSYNLPSAYLLFTNNFGEKQVLLSDHPTLSVIEQNLIQVSLVALDGKKPFVFKNFLFNVFRIYED